VTKESKPVWMLSARTGLNGVKGGLRIEGPLLVFQPESNRYGETSIPVSAIRRCRRVRGSPVLEVEAEALNLPPVIGFYFIKPPDLRETNEGSAMNPFRRLGSRKRALNSLRSANPLKKAELDAWVDAIRSAGGPS
jgi:hypothetical protein